MNIDVRAQLDEIARLYEILHKDQGSGLANTVNTIVISIRLDKLIEELKEMVKPIG